MIVIVVQVVAPIRMMTMTTMIVKDKKKTINVRKTTITVGILKAVQKRTIAITTVMDVIPIKESQKIVKTTTIVVVVVVAAVVVVKAKRTTIN